ncbi:DUF1194 domain-containing protein [Nisaea acidiphila]|uniref:DUF1194 domain-containing protein n=1 Tax=Nisaea acidiphila TaxID=1862145 RepID=A0A9J7ATJ8_9PROT|nr:DUF1194 domain-containing protein [Nisaea acidiphila]UUX48693.1 DUF1194 domain-containing protein [Nisaea acidiphila]
MRILKTVLGLACLFLAPSSVAQTELPVDVELVLAIDSSASVDRFEFELQLRGLALAFTDPEVQAAIKGGAFQSIAVTLVEWSSVDRQAVSIPWRLIDSAESANALAAEIASSPRIVETGATSISAAIAYTVPYFSANSFAGQRQVIDISGDGFNNSGRTMREGREIARQAGVIVNGLAIQNQVLDLGGYFEEYVITGPGAFVITADDYEDYIKAIRRKLLREIRAGPIS